ncbi:hypothetical protein, partial [Paraburkholderia caribensis]|uniref:hypothetical protein n=1 Tax=Paraburkholderia caribensis TaxID=75105 RepID=UPI001CC60424
GTAAIKNVGGFERALARCGFVSSALKRPFESTCIAQATQSQAPSRTDLYCFEFARHRNKSN